MTTRGVPSSEVTARDHIQVRAALVKRLGGANEAVVFGRIYYRADPQSRKAIEVDGEWWWQASYPDIEEQTGLSYKKVRAAVAELLRLGAIERRPARGSTFYYRPIVASESGLPSGAGSESALQGTDDCPPGHAGLPSGASVPLIDVRDVRDTPVVPEIDPVAAAMEPVWEAWPTARRSTRKVVTAKWRKAVEVVGRKDLDRLTRAAIAFGERYSTWAQSEQQFVPLLSTWLHQERWTTPLPEAGRGNRSTVDHGRGVDQILAEREAAAASERRAVSA